MRATPHSGHRPRFVGPETVRAYVDRVEEQVTTTEGRVGGVKTFRYLVVPDSAGPLSLPAVNYGYYDLAAHGYRLAALPAASLPVSSTDAPASTALPPGLLPAGSPGLASRMARNIPDWGWVVIFLIPPS